MIKGIMAVDDKGGISRGKSMPWPKNSLDLQWFKENTLNCVIVMGRKTWEDPFMPTPLKSRVTIIASGCSGGARNTSVNFPSSYSFLRTSLSPSRVQKKFSDASMSFTLT
jgi:dihydrofolate reductase